MKEIPPSPFANDDGSADPTLATLMAQWVAGKTSTELLTTVLAHSRLLVPVVAVLDESHVDAASGLKTEKDSHMAMPMMVRPDGRKGVLAFTCNESLQRWQADARAIPVWGLDAAKAAGDEADALVIDVMGPVRVAIEGQDLARMIAQ